MKNQRSLLLSVIVSVCINGCGKKSATTDVLKEDSPKVESITFLDGEIRAGDDSGSVRASEIFSVEGSFRIIGGSEPQPTTIKIFQNNVIMNEDTAKATREGDRVRFNGALKAPMQRGSYRIEAWNSRRKAVESQLNVN